MGGPAVLWGIWSDCLSSVSGTCSNGSGTQGLNRVAALNSVAHSSTVFCVKRTFYCIGRVSNREASFGVSDVRKQERGRETADPTGGGAKARMGQCPGRGKARGGAKARMGQSPGRGKGQDGARPSPGRGAAPPVTHGFFGQELIGRTFPFSPEVTSVHWALPGLWLPAVAFPMACPLFVPKQKGCGWGGLGAVPTRAAIAGWAQGSA